MRYYGNVMTSTKWRLCVARFLHLQQYSRRLNLLFFFFVFFSHNLVFNHKQLVGRQLNVLSSGEINWNLRYLIHYNELTSNRSKIFVTKPNCKTHCPGHPYNYSPKPISILFVSFQDSFRGTSHARQINRVATAVISRYTCTILCCSQIFLQKTWPYSIGRVVRNLVSPLFRPTSRFRSTERSIGSQPTSR